MYRKPYLFKKFKTKFCSRKCHNKYKDTSIEVKCVSCDGRFMRSAKRVRLDGINFCSHSCSAKHTNVRLAKERYADKNYSIRDYRRRALKVYGEKCSNHNCEITNAGIKIPVKLLDVDHKDNNRQNNRIGNLDVLCVWCHAKKTRKVV
jgi:hypothetical protein